VLEIYSSVDAILALDFKKRSLKNADKRMACRATIWQTACARHPKEMFPVMMQRQDELNQKKPPHS